MLRLQPHLPMLWRTPTSCQFGSVTPVLRIDELTPAQERVIAVLREGTTRPTMTALARQWGMSDADITDFLETMHPALAGPEAGSPRIALVGNGIGRGEIRQVLGESVTIVEDLAPDPGSHHDSVDVAVIVSDYFVAPRLAGSWLRRDIPHLLVSFDEQGATVGPLVMPGATPCAFCVELARRAADTSWVAVATQLTYAAHPEPTPLLRNAVSVAVGSAIRAMHTTDGVDPAPASALAGRRIRFTIDGEMIGGETTDSEVSFDDDCHCQRLRENVIAFDFPHANPNPQPTRV